MGLQLIEVQVTASKTPQRSSLTLKINPKTASILPRGRERRGARRTKGGFGQRKRIWEELVRYVDENRKPMPVLEFLKRARESQANDPKKHLQRGGLRDIEIYLNEGSADLLGADGTGTLQH